MLGRRRKKAEADEPTVRLARKDFARRRFAGRWRRGRYLVYGLVLALLLGASVWLVFFSSHVTVKRVEVTGEQSVSGVRVEQRAQVPMGRPLARVDLGSIRARVQAMPVVKSADVTRSWPHAVHIAITERTPLAVVERSGGFVSVDAEGVLFGRHEQRPQGLPLVKISEKLAAVAEKGQGKADGKGDTQGDGQAATDGASKDGREAIGEAAQVAAALPAGLLAKVDFVEVATIDQISLKLRNGRTVIWGSAADSDEKADVLVVLLKRPGTQLDVSVPARPTTR